MTTPRTEVVRQVLTALADHGVDAAIGGSGLLAALGLVESVRDWDVTTDAPDDQVVASLRAGGLRPVAVDAGGGVYATRARYDLDAGDHHIDVMVGFAVRTDRGVVPIRTQVTRTWRGLPVGDPHIWAVAYRAIGRTRSADLLDDWLSRGEG